MWFLRSNRQEKVPPFQQFQDCGGTGVASSKTDHTVFLFLCLFLRCPPGQEACLGCILTLVPASAGATGMEQQREGQRVSLPLRSPCLGLSEVQSVSTEQAAFGLYYFPMKALEKQSIDKQVCLDDCSGKAISPVAPSSATS